VSTVLLPLGATLAAGALTYWFCVRPIRSGNSCLPLKTSRSDTALTEEVNAAHRELDRLRVDQAAAPGLETRPRL
jgi:hypothetical protein